ncbi:MAG: amidohydrolase family protein, partial [Acidimicrobiia bacterium]
TTINAAAAMGIDDRVGSIEPGKVADLVVLENDILGPDLESSVATNRPLMTMIDGMVYFCEAEMCDQVLDLLAETEDDPPPPPTPGVTVTASGSRDTHYPELVLDGSTETESFWSSGADPPGWIQVEFDEPVTITALRFVVYQNPESNTVHVLEIESGGVWAEHVRFTGFTSTGDVLEWAPDDPQSEVTGFRITTVESLSWPEWLEFEIELAD